MFLTQYPNGDFLLFTTLCQLVNYFLGQFPDEKYVGFTNDTVVVRDPGG
jgi:hypothetical protein